MSKIYKRPLTIVVVILNDCSLMENSGVADEPMSKENDFFFFEDEEEVMAKNQSVLWDDDNEEEEEW